MAKIEAKQSANLSRIIKVFGSFLRKGSQIKAILYLIVTIDVYPPPLKIQAPVLTSFQ